MHTSQCSKIMSVTTNQLFILAWLYLILCVCPSLAQRSGSNNGSSGMTAVFFVGPVVLFLVSVAIMCGCFWTFVCLKRRRLIQAQAGNQSVLARPRPYLNTSTTAVQQQAQHDTSGTPAGYQYQPDDTTRAQPDLSNSTLQDAPPPPYEVAKNYSPLSSSAAFDPTAPQPFPPQFSDLPPEQPPQYPGVS